MKIGNVEKFLSRSKEYYNVKDMTELSNEREELKKMLNRMANKKNFVILENMLNCSGKVYFRKMQNYIKSKTLENEKEMNIARECLEEDVRNILVILSKEGLISVDPDLKLPKGTENSERRLIEMDNKAMLYVFCKALNLKGENLEVLTPGYGSLYIGPFLKEMYGYDYTNLLKSKYITEVETSNSSFNIENSLSSNRIFTKTSKIVLIDDNIGTGQTMNEIKSELLKLGISNISSGAIQFNWINYYRISIGDKRNDSFGNKIERFSAQDYELLSPFNYYGHKLCSKAIDRLHISGNEYINYLKTKSYRIDGYSDLVGSIERGMQYSEMAGINLSEIYGYSKRKERDKKDLLAEYIESIDSRDINRENVDRIICTTKNLVQNSKQLFELEK